MGCGVLVEVGCREPTTLYQVWQGVEAGMEGWWKGTVPSWLAMVMGTSNGACEGDAVAGVVSRGGTGREGGSGSWVMMLVDVDRYWQE